MNILVCDPDKNWVTKIVAGLVDRKMSLITTESGKDCQLKVYKETFDAIILDLDTSQHSAFEVLKYLKLNYPKIKIIFTINGKAKFESLGLDKSELKKLGICDLLIKPYSMDNLINCLEGEVQFSEWKNVSDNNQTSNEEEVTAKDEEFTRIKVTDFCSGNFAIFDHFIRLGVGKFVKILHKGEKLDPKILDHYIGSKKTDFLYFRTRDRGNYVNFVNELLAKAISTHSTPAAGLISLSKSLAEKYIDEVYTSGLRPQIVEEGIKMCQNMYDLVHEIRGLSDVLKEYRDYDTSAECHIFLTAFFSSLICKNLEWSTQRTAAQITMAAILHDIGKLKLPQELRNLDPSKMNLQQRKLYELHPLYGVDLLDKYPSIGESVKQIVYQHHETIDGNGFPNNLSGIRIFPMAKIVSVANIFSEILIRERITPLEGLKKIVSNEDFILKYDPNCIRALFMAFRKDAV